MRSYPIQQHILRGQVSFIGWRLSYVTLSQTNQLASLFNLSQDMIVTIPSR